MNTDNNTDLELKEHALSGADEKLINFRQEQARKDQGKLDNSNYTASEILNKNATDDLL